MTVPWTSAVVTGSGRGIGLAFARRLAAAGFEDVEIVPTRFYEFRDMRAYFPDADASLSAAIDGRFMSAFIRARKALTP